MTWFDTFEAKLYCDKKEPLGEKSAPLYKTPYKLKFSKNKVYFTKASLKEAGHITNPLQPFRGYIGAVRYTETYKLIKLDNDDVDRMKGSKFQIKLSNGSTFNIASGGLNGIKMRWIHGRYNVQRHWEWYWKTILAILFGAIITYFFNSLSYKKGFVDGFSAGRNSDTITNPSTNSKPN